MASRPIGNSPTQRAGAAFEDRAADRLAELGVRIVGRNIRTRYGELDLVGWDSDVLCFVEVRGRESRFFGHPAETVGWKKQRTLRRAAREFLARGIGPPPMCRFDIVAVSGAQADNIEWMKGAFE